MHTVDQRLTPLSLAQLCHIHRHKIPAALPTSSHTYIIALAARHRQLTVVSRHFISSREVPNCKILCAHTLATADCVKMNI